MRTETETGCRNASGFFMGDGMDAREKRQHLFASLYQEHLELARIIGDLDFGADLDLDELDHEIQCAHVRMDLELARIIGDLDFDADLDLDEVDHEIQCAHARMAFLKSMHQRLLLAV